MAIKGVVREASCDGVVAYRARQADGLACGGGVEQEAIGAEVSVFQVGVGALAEELCLALVAGVGISDPV